MKKIECEITSQTPILMNSPKAMLEPKNPVSKKTEKLDYEAEAEKLAYRDSKGFLYVPAQAIKGCMLNACSFVKIGKFSAKPIIAGGVRISPIEIQILDLKGKPVKDYEIDLRTVVIQGKNRVVKSRPKISNWKLNFEIMYNEKMISDNDIIRQILTDAGERIGILDFRPQKSGDFGCFQITKWKPK